MSLVVTFAHDIGDCVTVLALSLPGIVVQRADRGVFYEYMCVYWSDGKRDATWLLGSEISAAVKPGDWVAVTRPGQ